LLPVVVEGNRLRLRELSAGDHPALCRLWGDPAITRYMAFSVMSAQEVEQAIRQARAESRKRPRSDYMLAAADIAGDVLVGTIRMTIGAERSIYCGRLTVARELQKHGYAAEIVDLSNQFCFTVLNAHRVWGVVHRDNPAARQTLLNTGMTFEGCIRDFFYARGAWHTVESFSILEDEWKLRSAGRAPD
jgi:RimJ/RimL family protein N-acetyltransferase